LLDAHADGYSSPVPAAPLELVGVLFIVAVWFVVGLPSFLMIAARIVTRVVLGEIDKDRRRRGPR